METGFPALANEEESEIIFKYLKDRNRQFETEINRNGSVIEVKL